MGWLKNVIIFALLYMTFQNYLTNIEEAGINVGYEWGFEVGKDVGKEEACMVKAI